MSPIEKAKKLYGEEFSPRTFAEDFCLHLQNPLGIVVSTPEVLLLARQVNHGWSYPDLVDPRLWSSSPDCWWIYLLVGRLSFALLSAVRKPWLPYVGWERKNSPRIYKMERFERWMT